MTSSILGSSDSDVQNSVVTGLAGVWSHSDWSLGAPKIVAGDRSAGAKKGDPGMIGARI